MADGIIKPAPSARVTAKHELVDPASQGSHWGSATAAEMTGADAVDEDVYYSVLRPRMGSRFGEMLVALLGYVSDYLSKEI